ncbi:MAG TPA: hypothetical protein PK864_05335 [Syntrophorhabdaceae bacterium]|nr:hypothetical protein [Syntrophorhabdaceae bacterium]HOL06433.1 hypothetical protein [Syntrophorhabdaceae bacterium]HON85435.1 hypothetical protein [Syntrophorhabdaceae bacterium]
MNRESFIKYKALFRPDFIVIIGASSDLNKPGGKVSIYCIDSPIDRLSNHIHHIVIDVGV